MEQQASPLADRTNKCLDLYDSVSTYDGPDCRALGDTGSRFRLWAANLRTLHRVSDSRSADYRLREAPLIVRHLSEILDELSETLEDIRAIITGERVDQSQVGASSNSKTLEQRQGSQQIGQSNAFRASDEDQRSIKDHHGSYDLLPAGEEDEVIKPASELQELCTSLPDLLTSLFKVSIYIRKNTTRDRYAKAAAANYDEFLTEFDIAHVLEKFPKTAVHPWLQYRLWNAITKRRQYLRYVRDHRDKVARRPLPVFTAETQTPKPAGYSATKHPSERQSSSGPTVALTTASTLQASNTQPEEIPQEVSRDLDDDFGDTKSHATSFVSSRASDDSGKLRATLLQDMQTNGVEFECLYCGGIVTARKQRSWKRHVLRDLRAYVCTFEECSTGLFEDKHAWFQHELEEHRRQWLCASCPNKLFTSVAGLRKHLLSKHMSKVLSEVVDSAVQANSRTVTEIPASSCPLCDAWDETLRKEAAEKGLLIPQQNEVMMPLIQFQNHLAGHLEQLALFAIPPVVHRDIDSEKGSRDSKASKDRARILNFINQADEKVSGEGLQSTELSDDANEADEANLAGKSRKKSKRDKSSRDQDSSYMEFRDKDMPKLVREYYERNSERQIQFERLQDLDINHQEGLVQRQFLLNQGHILDFSDDEYLENYRFHREGITKRLEESKEMAASALTQCEAVGLDPRDYIIRAPRTNYSDSSDSKYLRPPSTASETPPLLAKYFEAERDCVDLSVKINELKSSWLEERGRREFLYDRGDELDSSDEIFELNYQNRRASLEKEVEERRQEAASLKMQCQAIGGEVHMWRPRPRPKFRRSKYSASHSSEEERENKSVASETLPLVCRYSDAKGDCNVFENRLAELDFAHAEGLQERDFLRDRGEELDLSEEDFELNYKQQRIDVEGKLEELREQLASFKDLCIAAGLEKEIKARSRTPSPDLVESASQHPGSQRMRRRGRNLNTIETLHIEYPTVVSLGGEDVVAISCPFCGMNAAASNKQPYFSGISGLQIHIEDTHNKKWSFDRVVEDCHKVRVSSEDAKRIRSGQKPLNDIPRITRPVDDGEQQRHLTKAAQELPRRKSH